MENKNRKTILILFGTRPEAIKLAPVIKALQQRTQNFKYYTCSTGQHADMVEQALSVFGLSIDTKLNVMPAATSLANLTGRLFQDIDHVLEKYKPDWLIVQGDTASAMVGSVCAFYKHIKVAHIEAGLRTHNKWSPFPEEINRVFISKVADIHFAPTRSAAEHLQKEGVPESSIHITGNTIVDAIHQVGSRLADYTPVGVLKDIMGLLETHRLILVTSHRRESFGLGLSNICHALVKILETHSDIIIVYPVHLNPNVRNPVYKLLGTHERIKLIEPVDYIQLIWLMSKSYFILTDSGGIQEEAPSLGKPILVMRDTTERYEAIENGSSRLVGTVIDNIVKNANELLTDKSIYNAMIKVKNPFGDGFAAERVVDVLLRA